MGPMGGGGFSGLLTFSGDKSNIDPPDLGGAMPLELCDGF